MKKPTPFMLDLYFQNCADDLIQFGDWRVWDALMEMRVCIERSTSKLGQLHQGVPKIDRVRNLMGRTFDQKRCRNALLKDERRPKPNATAAQRYYRCKEKQYWNWGGAADRQRLAFRFSTIEQEMQLALSQLFSVLEEIPNSGSRLQWCGYAGARCIAEYLILGRSISTGTDCQPGFGIMREYGVSPSHPEQSWTPATLQAEEVRRSQNPLIQKLLGDMDFASPCGIANGLVRLSSSIRTELSSRLHLGGENQIAALTVQGPVHEQAIRDLYERVALMQLSGHLADATASLSSYCAKLSGLEAQLQTLTAKRRVSKKIHKAQQLLKVLHRHLPNTMNVAAILFLPAMPAKEGEQILEQINRYERSLQADFETVLHQLREKGHGGLEWAAPNLICEVSIGLPDPSFDGCPEPLKMEVAIEWPLVASVDLMAKQLDGGRRLGKLAKALFEQCLPMWAWPLITEIEVRLAVSASMSMRH